MPDEVKSLIRKKFRATVLNFYKKYKLKKIHNLPALDALKFFIEERREQEMKLY